MVNRMKEYLEKTLRQIVRMEKDDAIIKQLPLLYRGRYDIYRIWTNGIEWEAIEPKYQVGLVSLRKDRLRIEKQCDLNCAIFLKTCTFYIKEKLLEEGIPFVLENKQVYLPFIGLLLKENTNRVLKPVHLISFLTQKMFILAIYEHWQGMIASHVAERMKVSRMSVTRCFDEIEYLGIDIIKRKGKSRAINIPDNTKKLWNDYVYLLRTPVIKTFMLDQDIKLEKQAGISALSHLSLLTDNHYPTYAIIKSEIEKYEINKYPQVDLINDANCIVYELGYFINFKDKNIQDPLSIMLSLEKEREDERVEMAIEEMLEEYVW